jgi:aldose 1-epimerase
VEKSSYGATKAGEAVDVYTLKNDNGATVKFISYGGIITDIDVPDRWGRVGNVVLGFKNLADYETKNPYFGALIGRYGNRIGAAKFTLNGAEYKLAANNGPNSCTVAIKASTRWCGKSSRSSPPTARPPPDSRI